MKISHLFLGFLAIGLGLGLQACGGDPKQPDNQKPQQVVRLAPDFKADTAYLWIEKQLSFGPRIPNLASHKACGDWIVKKFKDMGATVQEQNASITAHDGKTLAIRNIIASVNPQVKQRIMLSAHWDSRPWGDEDSVKKDKPIPAANDAGSGVAVLMEIVRQLQLKNPAIGVDVFLWDAEDYGKPDIKDSYCYGSQYWAKHQVPSGYNPFYGINLDMVGASGAVFTREEVSIQFASNVLDKVWGVGNELGYGNYFVYQNTSGITDDHLYVNMIAKIPMIDIIDRRQDPNNPENYDFFQHWHTHQDDMQSISKETLKAVGQTLLEVIYREKPI